MDEAQLLLIQYAHWYKSLWGLPLSEQPASEVYDDDVTLDKWWEGYQRKVARASAAQSRGQPMVQAASTSFEFKG